MINKRIRKCREKSVNHGLTIAFFTKQTFFEFLEVLPQSIQFSAVLMLFPDPWPKARHHRRRMVQTELLDELAARVREKGRFYFRTDYLPYYEWSFEKLQQHPSWVLDTELEWPHETVTYFQNLMGAYYSLQAHRL